MAYPLNSPGVDVSVTDESFYATAGDGTVPLIIIGTHEYKIGPNSVDIAEGTLPENANKLYLVTSQRELVQTFGNPVFYQSEGTSRHGYELNEFGLHAAYSYLGIANKAFIIRGALDYSQMFPRTSEPVGEPFAGTYWLDDATSVWGIHLGSDSTFPSSAWSPEVPNVIDNASEVENRVIGSQSFANATDQVISTAGNLVINGVVVSLTGGSTLLNIQAAINLAGITGVTASVFQLSGTSQLLIRNSATGGSVTIGTNSTPAVTAALGLDGTESSTYGPRTTIGVDGDFSIVLTQANDNEIYQKLRAGGIATINDPLASSFWFLVGSDSWKAATPTRATGSNLGSGTLTGLAGKTLTINTSNNLASGIDVDLSTSTDLASVAAEINTALALFLLDPNKGTTASSIVAVVSAGSLVLVNKFGGDIILNSASDAAVVLGLETEFGVGLAFAPHYSLPSRIDDLGRKRVMSGDVWINTTQYNNGANWSVKYFNGDTGLWVTVVAPLLSDDTAANALFGTSKTSGTLYVQYNTGSDGIASFQIRRWNTQVWESLVYNYGPVAPTTDAEEGTLWFNDNFKVDVMVNDGDQWVGYRNYAGNINSSINGVILQATTPTVQQNGQPLGQNDLWINTGDLENYPKMYRYDATNRAWTLIDNTDSVTPFGVLFADARWTSNGLRSGPQDAASFLVSDFVDPDAPDPRVYPEGTLLFNTRYSTYNVKEYRPSYFSGEFGATDYSQTTYDVGFSTFDALVDTGRWVTVSGNDLDGSPFMGRKAQRAMVVRALTATINSNEDVRAESIYFNLIATPGYVELIDEMVNLNTDKKQVAFVVGDTPIRLDASATSLNKWANVELSGATANSEQGLTTFDAYTAVFYPWGLTTNVDGFEIMIPPATMALRTIAYSDSVSYPWFPPAGTNRGLITNATNVGYLDSTNAFRSVLLNEGQRDVLYSNNINPIAYIPNRGLMIYGQKTRNSTATALDRINVARLINYMRYNLDGLSRPFLFELHTFHTRDSIRIAFERYLASLVNLNAMYDFIVVCDETNNTPDRIDRNELWVDVAIQPTKAVEFIYIPIRIVNTGDDLSELYATSTTL